MQDVEHQVERWRVAAATVKGEGHSKSGADCDDSYFVGQTSNGYLAAIVSDGAGSAEFGGFAARDICLSGEQFLADLENMSAPAGAEAPCQEGNASHEAQHHLIELEQLVQNRLAVARDRLLEHAAKASSDPKNYLATVVGVVAHPGIGVLIFHLGDGAATVFAPSGEALITSQPMNGEYLNQTYFLVEDWWKEHLRFCRSTALPVGSIFMMTDGVTELAYHRHGRVLSPSASFFGPLQAFLCARKRQESEAAMCRLLDTERARDLVDDDKTLLWIRAS
jgi:hypothetical protein